MTSVFLTWFNPLYWVFNLFYQFFKLPLTVARLIAGCWRLMKKEWNRFDSIIVKVIYTSIVGWVAFPGTMTWTFYQSMPYLQHGANAVGLGEEFGTFVSIVEGVVALGGVVLGAAWEAAKFAYYLA